MPNKRLRTPSSTPPKYCSEDCRRRSSKPKSKLDGNIVEIFLIKLKESRPLTPGVMCNEVANAVPLEVTPARPEPARPQDLRERVRCVARRSVVLDTQGLETKGRLRGVEAVTPQGGLISGEQLSTYKGEFGLRKKEAE